MRLSNKVALITGAGSGIGRETARLFANEGANVVLTDINSHGGNEATGEIQANGGEALFIEHDVAKEDGWQNVIKKALEAFGRLDILVNSAGIGPFATIEEITFEEWRKVLSINLDGTFLGVKYGIEAMKKTGKGSIINIASIQSIIADPGLPAYNASKAGVAQLTKSAALHCAKAGLGIRINSIHPGYIKTPLLKNVDDIEEMITATPIGHLGEAIDIANGALYLASDESKFTTGSQLVIDGGYTAQ